MLHFWGFYNAFDFHSILDIIEAGHGLRRDLRVANRLAWLHSLMTMNQKSRDPCRGAALFVGDFYLPVVRPCKKARGTVLRHVEHRDSDSL